jgi:hypothetical protein
LVKSSQVAAAAEGYQQLSATQDLNDCDDTVELLFDPDMNSYYDPATLKYYDIRPDT